MDPKKINKSIGRFLGWVALILCSLIVKITPRRWIYAFAKNAAFLGYIIAGKQRRIALESLSIAFGQDKTSDEIKRIARDCFVAMAKGGVELLFLSDKPELLRRSIEIAGRDNLDAALSKGKGVILVSAHFGNFPIMLARLSLEGYPVTGIMRPMRDSRVEKMFMARRARFQVKTIYSQPRKACVEGTIRVLRNNGIIFIPLDQNFGSGGVFVDFFGKKAATATGPVVLARRTKAAILPCFIVRQRDDTHKIIVEPPFDSGGDGAYQDTLLIVQKLTGIIESYIRRYPEQWGWIHRRWKSRPN